MSKKIAFMLASTLGFFLTIPMMASAADHEEDVHRLDRSARVFREVMDTPDKGIPHDLLDRAKCIGIIPGEIKFAFIFGANYGRGVATCRTADGWSAPMFIALQGGSVGYQIGGSSTDIIMLFMNDHALGSLLGDKVKLGADASVAAGPVGRTASADTDVALRAEILTYSRAHGLFAGVSLQGSELAADRGADRAMYGDHTRREIVDGKVRVPEPALALVHELGSYNTTAENR
jgi:lipid-binding SYLF domain-containing protein